ncbi:hypothetical protein VKT23_014028 [Stygiomarasmius scandens]|uniref:Uncharacterized protein n=1 Tax=Marasmiellus scandens TaxID=2682957 RepID=A0ABR1J319_9AGAR
MPPSLKDGKARDQRFIRPSRLHLCQCDTCVEEVVPLQDGFITGRLLGWNEYKRHQLLKKKYARLAQYDLSPPSLDLPLQASAAVPFSSVLSVESLGTSTDAEPDEESHPDHSDPELDFTIYEVNQLYQVKAMLEQSPAESCTFSNSLEDPLDARPEDPQDA